MSIFKNSLHLFSSLRNYIFLLLKPVIQPMFLNQALYPYQVSTQLCASIYFCSAQKYTVKPPLKDKTQTVWWVPSSTFFSLPYILGNQRYSTNSTTCSHFQVTEISFPNYFLTDQMPCLRLHFDFFVEKFQCPPHLFGNAFLSLFSLDY